MRFLATKDTHEREEAEAERLIRPSPKDKPPRKDLRRQTTDADRDPDTSGDPDLKGDPDMSLNYKNVGGSMVDRVVHRYAGARSKLKQLKPVRRTMKYVTVLDKQEKKTVSVPETTLKNNPSKYQVVQKGSPAAESEVPSQNEGQEATKPPSVQSAPQEAESKPAGQPSTPDLEPKDKGKPPTEAPSEPPKSVDPKQKASLVELGKAVGDDPEAKTHFQEFLKDLPSSETDESTGQTLIFDVKTKTRVPLTEASPATIQKIKEKYQSKLLDGETSKALEGYASNEDIQEVLQDLAFIGGKTKEEGEQEGSVAKRIRELQKSGEDLASLSLVRHIPELKDVKLPEGLRSVKDLVDVVTRLDKSKPAKSDSDEKTKAQGRSEAVVERFKKEQLGSDEFKAFAEKLPTTEKDEEGNPLFWNKARNKAVPFEKLPPDVQANIVEKYTEEQQLEQHKELAKTLLNNPKYLDVSQQLQGLSEDGGPSKDGPIQARIQKLLDEGYSLEDLPVAKNIPELSGIELPPSIRSVADLMPLAKLAAPPPPERPEYAEEEHEALVSELSQVLKGSAFKGRSDTDEIFDNLSSLHPMDLNEVLQKYHTLQSGSAPSDLKKFIKSLATYQTSNPGDILPPEKVKVEGKEVALSSLPPEKQAEAFQEYKNEAIALNLASKPLLAKGYAEQGVPANLAQSLASEAKPPHQMFNDALRDGASEAPLDKKQIKKIFKNLPDEQKAAATAYFQARDYQAVKEKYLDSHAINERLSTPRIIQQVTKAVKELKDREALYPEGLTVEATTGFRNRVLQRLEDLHAVGQVDDDKFKAVQKWVFQQNADDFDDSVDNYYKAVKKGYKGLKRPTQYPTGYAGVRLENPRGPKEQSRVKDVWDAFKTLIPGRKKSSVRVASRYLSFCAESEMMPVTTHKDRQAVYWGVEPYPKGHEGFAPYNEWEQSHACDLGEKDEKALLSAARDWLKEPILDLATMGEGPADARYRAALDFALQTLEGGRYGMGLHPAKYNELLARLAGVSPDQTLVTIREASVSLYTPPSVRTSMPASNEIRQYAAKIASVSPSVAFDLVALADKVAQQEADQQQAQQQKQAEQQDQAEQEKGQQKQAQQQDQAEQEAGQQKQAYTALRSAVIRTATANPVARQALQPVLKLIQQLG